MFQSTHKERDKKFQSRLKFFLITSLKGVFQKVVHIKSYLDNFWQIQTVPIMICFAWYCFLFKNNLIGSKIREKSGFMVLEFVVGSDDQFYPSVLLSILSIQS